MKLITVLAELLQYVRWKLIILVMGKYGLDLLKFQSLYDTTLMLKFVWQVCILLSHMIDGTCFKCMLSFSVRILQDVSASTVCCVT